jgi:hypothetical protein
MFLSSLVDVPNLEKIQHQVYEILPDWCKNLSTYKPLSWDKLKQISEFNEVINMFASWDQVAEISAITLEPKSAMPIHVDTNWPSRTAYSLNLPLVNCLSTDSIFYEPLPDTKPIPTFTAHGGHPYWLYKTDQVKEIKRWKLSKAAIFNTLVPHGAENNTYLPRIVLSVRFNKDVDLLKFVNQSDNC